MVCALGMMTACKSFETDAMYQYHDGLYCSLEVNGVAIDTVLIDNGYYHSAVSPDLAESLNLSYTVLKVDTTLGRTGSKMFSKVVKTCTADSLYYTMGHTVIRLDTIFITKYHELFMTNCKAVIGRNVFEQYVVEIDYRNKYMVLSNHLPETIGQYMAIPMEYTNSKDCQRHRCIKVDGFKLKDGSPASVRAFLDLGNAAGTAFDSAFLTRVDQHFSQIDTASLAWLILSQIGLQPLQNHLRLQEQYVLPEEERIIQPRPLLKPPVAGMPSALPTTCERAKRF